MHAHKHVRKHKRRRIGVAVLAVVTSFIAVPHAQAAPIARTSGTESAQAAPTKKSKRHWGRIWGWSRPGLWLHHTPTAIEIVLAKARAQLGKPYVYGSDGPNSFDCSGLTMFVWAAASVALPHNAAAQYDAVRHVATKDLRPGDLVFFGHRGIGHVGLYIGGGKMIHAPYTGTSVQVAPLQSDLVGAGRPSRAGH